MKLISLFIVFGLSSCGIAASLKNAKDMESKGYDRKRDTIDIKPYEYFIYHKGYFPFHQELKPENSLDIKISIKGYENTDSIPFDRIFQSFQLSLNEHKIDSIKYGELIFYTGKTYYVKYLCSQCKDENKCSLSFDEVKKSKRKLGHNSFLLFWNVTALKNGITYILPSRKYILH